MQDANAGRRGMLMIEDDHAHLKTVADILYAWSRDEITTAQAIAMLHIDSEQELIESAIGSAVPLPKRLSQ